MTRDVISVPLDHGPVCTGQVALRKGPRIFCEHVCDCATPLWAPDRSCDISVCAGLVRRYLAYGFEHLLLKLAEHGYGHVIIGKIHRSHTVRLFWPELAGRVVRRFPLCAFLWLVFFVTVKLALWVCYVYVGNVRPPGRVLGTLNVECCLPRHAVCLCDWYTNCVIV